MGAASSMPNLRALPGNWHLPVWPSSDKCRDASLRALNAWLQRMRIPSRTRRQLLPRDQRMRHDMVWSLSVPMEWEAAQQPLQQAVLGGQCIISDDKDKGKMWSVPIDELCMALVDQMVHATDAWELRTLFDPCSWRGSAAELCRKCLPAWLLKRR